MVTYLINKHGKRLCCTKYEDYIHFSINTKDYAIRNQHNAFTCELRAWPQYILESKNDATTSNPETKMSVKYDLNVIYYYLLFITITILLLFIIYY